VPRDVDRKQRASALEVEKAQAQKMQQTGKTAAVEAAAEEEEGGKEKCQLGDELTMQPSAEA
jgi:hypothetical protein